MNEWINKWMNEWINEYSVLFIMFLEIPIGLAQSAYIFRQAMGLIKYKSRFCDSVR